MQDATPRLEALVAEIEAIEADAYNGELYLPEMPRVLVAGSLIGTVLIETRRREQGTVPLAQGGMDHSVPAGDR